MIRLQYAGRNFLSVLVLLGLLMNVASAQLQASKKLGNSLDMVPANASFYSASFRLKEQWEILAKSKAWKTLTELGSVQLGLGQLRAEMSKPGMPLDEYNKLMLEEENVELQELLLDLVSNEVFLWGDKQASKTLDLYVKTANAAQYGPMIANFMAAFGGGVPQNDPNIILAAIMQSLNSDLDSIAIPNIVLGFKLSKPEIADKQMQRVELLVTRMLANAPPLVEKFKRTKVAGSSFLMFDLESDLIPWEDIPWDELESEPGEFDKLKNKLRQLKLNVSLGVKDGYLMFGISSSSDYIAKWGKEPLLINSKSFTPLQAHLSKPLTSVNYADSTIREAGGAFSKKDVHAMASNVETILDLFELEDDLNNRIIADVGKLADDLASVIPELGDAIDFSYLTPTGYEGYAYDWSENLYLDSSKPLTMLTQLGGNPIMAYVSRGKYRPQDYDLVVKWAKVGYSYFEDFGKPQLSPDELGQVEDVLERVIPMLQRFDGIVRTNLLPSTKDSQSAIVLDNKITSKQLVGPMPAAKNALPIPELGILVSVNDAKLLKEGFVELKKIGDDIVTLVRDLEPSAIPEGYKIPEARTRTLGSGEVWWYDIPAELADEVKLDSQILPHIGLNKDVGLISNSPRLTGKIFAGAPFESDSFLQKVRDQPLGSLAYVNIAAMMEMLVAWSDYGFVQALKMDDDGAEKAIISFAQNDTKTILRILGCLKSYSSYTRTEDKAMVTHSQLLIEDLK